MAFSKGQCLGYLSEAHAPFKKHQFVLLNSLSADPVKVTSLTDSKVSKDVSRNKISLLEDTTLVLKSDSPLSAEKFITQLIEIGRTQLFDVAFQQNIISHAEKVHILHLAANKGSSALFSYLLEKFPDINLQDRDSNDNNLIHAAVTNTAHPDVLDILLKRYTNDKTARDDASDNSDSSDSYAVNDVLYQKNYARLTPLLLAIKENCPNSVRKLIAACCSMRIGLDKDDKTAVHYAARLNRAECLEIMSNVEDDNLEDYKKILVLKNKLKLIPVMLAEDTASIKILLKHFDIEKVVSDELGSILHWASGNDNMNLVRVLLSLDNPAKVNKKNGKGFTPLKISAKRGFARIVEVLLKEGDADPDFIGKEVGFTALNNAAQYGQLEAVKVLVDNGASLSQENMTNTALHSAVYGGQAEITKYFLKDCEMNPDILNNAKRPPLFQAISENHPDCLKLLLEHNATLTTPVDTKNSTPLHLAVEKGETQLVKLLLDHGARPEESNTDGITPLILTTKEDHASLIPLLMSYGIALAKVDNSKNTVFHHAAINGATNCVDYLVKRMQKMSGVTQTFQIYKNKNSDNKTAFDIALEKHQESVLATFIKYAPENFFTENSKCLHQMYEKKMYATMKAIFDTMAKRDTFASDDDDDDEMTVTVEFLDSNELGQYPRDKGYNHMIPSLLHKMLNCPEVTLKYHPIVNIVVNKKLVIYRWWYILSFIFFIFFLLSLGYALIQASYVCDDQLLQYTDPYNIVRLCCEIFCILCWMLFFVDELIEFIIEWVQKRHERRNSKDTMETIRISKSEGTGAFKVLFKCFQKVSNYSKLFESFDRLLFYFPSAVFEYIFGFNIVDFAALVCFVILVALRIAGSYIQWTFASFTFILFALRLFKYTRIIPSLGAYVRSVFRVFVRDIPRFIVIVLILSISYLGGIHLAARQQPQFSSMQTVSLNQEVCTNRSFSQLLWFNDAKTLNYDLRKPIISSIIFLLDGGPGNVEDDLLNVNIVFVILYIIFAFSIIVVLLNILIAQLSETYSEIIKTNEFHYKMELVVNLELKSNLAFITGKFLRKYNTINKLEIPVSIWENLKTTCPGKSMEQQVDEINDKLRSSEMIIKEEALKAIHNQEWIQGKISTICDFISDSSDKSAQFGKGSSSDPMTFARISVVENKMNSLEKKIDRILTAIQAKSE
ncbi:Serine/threonine-protein phosphatase 6 [Oopsacas minuta]|uniref:Serine/threonine-protein phosphatase 6 n=1 Tax=Oopsacas minuta TaxID=111878 RepID=A0AAV7KHC6_9METZ|nr:Serine/threonine-protein phosphatase 6 [Oopsacas minuta]